jgi:hypothetical protein
MTPEYGEEVRMRQQSQGPRQRPEREGVAEREIIEHDREDREVEYLDPESNEAHAAGQVCARCGQVITASQDVRRRPEGRWMHEVCPRDLGVPSAGPTQPEGRG